MGKNKNRLGIGWGCGVGLWVFCLLASCNSSGDEGKDPAAGTVVPAPAAAAAPETFILKKGRMAGDLKMPGELIAYQQVDLYAKENSFVKKLYVDVGSQVSTGQLLAVMEAPELM